MAQLAHVAKPADLMEATFIASFYVNLIAMLSCVCQPHIIKLLIAGKTFKHSALEK